jgi:hypothetical protein
MRQQLVSTACLGILKLYCSMGQLLLKDFEHDGWWWEGVELQLTALTLAGCVSLLLLVDVQTGSQHVCCCQQQFRYVCGCVLWG